MNRLLLFCTRGMVAVTLLYAGFAPPAQAAPDAPNVCGVLGDNTWSLLNGPYEVCTSGATVPAGKTLTIDAGVTVKFDALPGNSLVVQGTLVANGTAAQPITLTGMTTTPGSWGGILANGTLTAPAQVSLNYVNLDYGGVSGSSDAEVYADQALVTITNSVISHSAGNGVYASINAHFDAHTTNFVSNAQNAIQLNQPSTSLLMRDLTASLNGSNGVRLVGTSTFHGVQQLTFPGIPYIVDAPITNALGDELTIDPGSILEFTSLGWLYIRGRLNAVGTPSQPITLTSPTQTIGGWRGLFIDGGLHQAVAQLDYVTLEYAGSNGAAIEVVNGRLNVHHSIIRHSLTDGVRFDSNWGGSILESQIVDNTAYGLRNNTPDWPVLATNDWWGDVNGPQSDVPGCSTGLGSKVSAGVLFTPVLPGPTATAILPLSSAPILTITPRRWFAPADGLSKIYFDITVRDGNGAPIPGRTVKIITSLGAVTDGGVTDPSGKTLAFLTSQSVGDADVTASLVSLSSCGGALSPETNVTFTQPVTGADLLPNAPASYFDGDIQASPLPLEVSVPATISAKLTNPTATPITVDVNFGIAQSGIGLVFGPIADVVRQVIPANSSITVSAPFTPLISGHYCFQVTYAITAIGLAPGLQPQASGGRRLKNYVVKQGSMGSPTTKGVLDKADKSFKRVSKLPSGPTQIQKGIVGKWWQWAKKSAEDISKGLGFDPPRQDYNQVTLPMWHPIPPVLPDANISAARAAALNAVNTSLADIEAYGTAATTAMDRYGGASEANNLQWASEQANEQLYYQAQLGTALMTYADRVDAFVKILQDENEPAINVSAGDVTSYQQRLTAQGFSPDEVANAKLIGWSQTQIDAFLQEIIAADPTTVAGNLLTIFTNEASVSRELGNVLLNPPIFAPSIHVSGSAGLSPEAAGNSMAQVYNSVTTVLLGNPTLQTATITVSARRIDLPADWSLYVTPSQITLDPGKTATVTLTIVAGSPVPQGALPRVAVEGYASGVLLGGVVVDTTIPNYAPFDGKLHVYLPLLSR